MQFPKVISNKKLLLQQPEVVSSQQTTSRCKGVKSKKREGKTEYKGGKNQINWRNISAICL